MKSACHYCSQRRDKGLLYLDIFVTESSSILYVCIRESVDSLCRDGTDMPRPPYIGKACTRPNLEDLKAFLGI